MFTLVGRMALTNYLPLSLIVTWVFNGYGLSLWNRVAPGDHIAGSAVL